MYGLINKAVHDLVCQRFGVETWNKIRTRAGAPDEPYVSMEQYPDSTTYDLVGAATAELGVSAEDILREFGKFWTIYTAEVGYGELMRTSGSTFAEFVRNLDQLHARVKLSFPRLRPPSFAVTDETPHSITVNYYSERPGLAPLVMGILDGLAERFKITISIQHSSGAHLSPPCEVFAISWPPSEECAAM